MKIFLAISGVFLLLVLGYYAWSEGIYSTNKVASYEECVAKGNKVVYSDPPECYLPNGRKFVAHTSTPPDNIIDPDGVWVAFKVLETAEGMTNSYDGESSEYKAFLFTNNNDLQTIYSQVNTLSSMQERPTFAIDFERKNALLVMTDVKPSGGFKVEISKIVFQEDKGDLFLEVTEYAPAASCLVTAVVTRPYHFVEIPKLLLSDADSLNINVSTTVVSQPCE